MPRGRKPRTWVKMDCEGLLRGSINYLFSDLNIEDIDIEDVIALACQAVWLKMIAFSEVCGGRPGFIEDNNMRGYPIKYTARALQCPVHILQNVMNIMRSDSAIKIHDSGSVELINFNHYQFSEYDRQKKYRNKDNNGNGTDPDKYIEGKYGQVVKR